MHRKLKKENMRLDRVPGHILTYSNIAWIVAIPKGVVDGISD